MANRYRVTAARRLANRLVAGAIRLGVGPDRLHLLTVPGRRTGQPRTTPVSLVRDTDGRWLVAPYGAVGWVHNVRAAGQVTLRRGRRVETVPAVEVGAAQAAPVLKTYVAKEAIVRPYFDATPDAPVEAFAAEAARHPVFRLG